MEKAPLSIIIIAKNEEKRLGPCIESVAWAKEVIVIDDDSSDHTAELATDMGAKVYRRKMDIEGRQRNFGFEKAQSGRTPSALERFAGRYELGGPAARAAPFCQSISR